MKYTLKKSGSASNRINAFDENGNKLFVIEVGYSEDKRVDREIVNLIDAAPDLLEACKAFLELFKNSDMRPEDESHEIANIVQMAVNKALD